jgi:hypothetical protein
MENQTFQNRQPFMHQISLPNSTAVLVLGIVSIALCWCYGIVGIACGVIALVLSNKDKLLYEVEPDNYTISSYNNMKAGRTCGIIGICLSSLVILFYIVYFLIIGAAITGGLPWDQF